MPTFDNNQGESLEDDQLTLCQHFKLLFSTGDDLHGNMDASEYKEYIFVMLFLKRLSILFDQERKEWLRNNGARLDKH
jgi:type I restriction-modification system DNA methylase subunit